MIPPDSGRPAGGALTRGPEERLRRRADFERVFEKGVRTHTRLMTVIILPNGLAASRLGVSATKKLGDAVRRNRAKRLIREVFRRNKPETAVDIVVIPRRELFETRFAGLEADYRSVLARRIRSRG